MKKIGRPTTGHGAPSLSKAMLEATKQANKDAKDAKAAAEAAKDEK